MNVCGIEGQYLWNIGSIATIFIVYVSVISRYLRTLQLLWLSVIYYFGYTLYDGGRRVSE